LYYCAPQNAVFKQYIFICEARSITKTCTRRGAAGLLRDQQEFAKACGAFAGKHAEFKHGE